jgi:hypothetical protein
MISVLAKYERYALSPVNLDPFRPISVTFIDPFDDIRHLP